MGGFILDMDNLIYKLKKRKAEPIGILNKYATLIPLIKIDNRWEIIFELRANTLKSQPGEISLPGGGLEKGESFKDAALRETVEELGIGYENLKYIGKLNYLISYGNVMIHCFLGLIDGIDIDDIKPNPDEVDHIFTVPIDFFMENPPKEYFLNIKLEDNEDFPYHLIPNGMNYPWKTGRHSILFYEYGEYIIWGYTAKMIKDFIKVIKELEIDTFKNSYDAQSAIDEV